MYFLIVLKDGIVRPIGQSMIEVDASIFLRVW